ncbi:MAG: hypothetical protein AAGG07_10420 [Planctomycetota bacterium]
MSRDRTDPRAEGTPLPPEVTDSLKRLYGPLGDAEAPPLPESPEVPAKRFSLRIAGFAAAAAVTLVSLVIVQRALGPARLDAEAMFAHYTTAFEPTYVCDTPGSFRQYSARVLGVSISADYEAGVAFVGWRKPDEEFVRSGRRDRATTMYATSEHGVGLLVIFNGHAQLPAQSDLNVFEGELGGVRVVEVSPLETPTVLPLLTTRAR